MSDTRNAAQLRNGERHQMDWLTGPARDFVCREGWRRHLTAGLGCSSSAAGLMAGSVAGCRRLEERCELSGLRTRESAAIEILRAVRERTRGHVPDVRGGVLRRRRIL